MSKKKVPENGNESDSSDSSQIKEFRSDIEEARKAEERNINIFPQSTNQAEDRALVSTNPAAALQLIQARLTQVSDSLLELRQDLEETNQRLGTISSQPESSIENPRSSRTSRQNQQG